MFQQKLKLLFTIKFIIKLMVSQVNRQTFSRIVEYDGKKLYINNKSDRNLIWVSHNFLKHEQSLLS